MGKSQSKRAGTTVASSGRHEQRLSFLYDALRIVLRSAVFTSPELCAFSIMCRNTYKTVTRLPELWSAAFHHECWQAQLDPASCVPSDQWTLIPMHELRALHKAELTAHSKLGLRRGYYAALYRNYLFWRQGLICIRQKALKNAERELAHFEAILPLYSCLYRHTQERPNDHDVVGLLGDLIWFNDKRVANAISLKRGNSTQVAIFRTMKSFLAFKQTPYTYNKPSLNFALNSDFSAATTAFHELDRKTKAGDKPPGFIGFVVDLARMRPDHEHLRETVLYTVYRDMMVFETTAEGQNYIENFNVDKGWFVGLDYVVPPEKAHLAKHQIKTFFSNNPKRCNGCLTNPNEQVDNIRKGLFRRADKLSRSFRSSPPHNP